MLVGVWRSRDGSQIRIGLPDPATGIGAYDVAGPGQRDGYHHTYRIIRSDESSRTVTIDILFADRSMLPSTQEMSLAEDGGLARRKILSAGFALLQWMRVDRTASDVLMYTGPQ